MESSIKHTSNRAELRSVIGVLQFRDWASDCNKSWNSLVIATDSAYVAVNATGRIKRWEVDGWHTYDGKAKTYRDIKNQDLWMLLLVLIRRLRDARVDVFFWRIPRDWNTRADENAKLAATWPSEDGFYKIEADGERDVKMTPFRFHPST